MVFRIYSKVKSSQRESPKFTEILTYIDEAQIKIADEHEHDFSRESPKFTEILEKSNTLGAEKLVIQPEPKISDPQLFNLTQETLFLPKLPKTAEYKCIDTDE